MGGDALKTGEIFTIDFPINGAYETFRCRKFRAVSITSNRIDLEFVEEIDPDNDLFD